MFPNGYILSGLMANHLDLGRRLKEERESLNLTQAELAAQTGIGRGTQIRYENGGRSPSAKYLSNAERVGINTRYVITGQRHTPPAFPNEETSDIHTLKKLCSSTFGIEFISTAPCPRYSSGCKRCTDENNEHRWKITDTISDDVKDANPFAEDTRLLDGRGVRPMAGMSAHAVYSLILSDPLATNRELALAEMVCSLDSTLREEAFYDCYDALLPHFARVICRHFQAMHKDADREAWSAESP